MDILELKKLIDNSDNIVFFGGAGVSTESNIPDFRSSSGLYTTSTNKSYPPEYMLSYTCYKNNTEDFYDFYKKNMIYLDAKPNLAHNSLTKLEERGKLKAVVTQNIDGLHQLAGTKNVYELHGSVRRNYCEKCNEFYDLDYVMKKEGVPLCEKCNGIVKPDVVLYEEGLDMEVMNKAIESISKCDILIVGGTSLTVYPAAGLLEYYNNDKLILINKSATQFDNRARLTFKDSIGKVLDSIIYE